MPSNTLTMTRRFPIKPLAALLMLTPCITVAAAETTIDTLVITARHWQENARQLPATPTLLTPEPDDHELWSSLESLTGRTANARLEDSSVQKRIVLRGITAVNTGLQDPLGVFVDGVGLPLGLNQAPALFNLDRIELLKGPQGTLYGRNTEAGALRLITPAPAQQLETWARLSQLYLDNGNGEQRSRLAAGVSGPLNDALKAGLAIRAEGGSTGIHNTHALHDEAGDFEQLSLSASADLDLSQRTRLAFRSRLDRTNNDMERMRYASGPLRTDPFTTAYNRDAYNEQHTGVHSIRLTHQLPTAELTAITGVSHYDRHFIMDMDASTLPAPASALDQDNRMWSQEIRLASLPSAARQWLIGLYLFNEDSDIDFSTGAPTTLRHTNIDQEGVALFGQVEFPLGERWMLTTGARLEYLDQSGNQDNISLLGQRRYSADHGNTEFLPNLGLSYHLTDGSLAYFNLSRGYLPGSYNYNQASDAESFTYDAEYTDTAELGLKTDLFNGQLEADINLFYSRISDKQIVDLQPGGTQSVSNAAKARSYGLELALKAPLGQGWQLDSTFGLQHAEATDYTQNTFSGGQLVRTNLSGNKLPLAAPYTYSLGVQYDKGYGWFGQARLNGSGGYYFDSQNQVKQSAWQSVDMELGYAFRDYRLSLAAQNLFDEQYYTRALNTPNGLLVEDAAAREISLNLSARW